jgi:uncharacterized RDD family membrane protein YckC
MRDQELALLLLVFGALGRRNGGDADRLDGDTQGVLSRVASRATEAVVDMVDPDIVLERVDVDAVMERVDVNGLIERVDVNALMERVDVDALIERVDVNALMERVDVNALIERVDVDGLMQRVDVEALVARVDVKDIADRAGIPDIVRESTTGLAGSAWDLIRRQIVTLDSILGSTIYRVRGKPAERPQYPPDLEEAGQGVDETGRAQVTGHYAGPVSRLLAFLADLGLIWFIFVFLALGVTFILELFLATDISEWLRTNVISVVLFALWAFLYFWFSLALAGRTPGMSIIGLRVLTRKGDVINGRQAFVRTIVFPFSFIFMLGFLGMLFSPERRTLHDTAAGTIVVYDWGDRPAELSAPLTAWVNRHAEAAEVPEMGAAEPGGD